MFISYRGVSKGMHGRVHPCMDAGMAGCTNACIRYVVKVNESECTLRFVSWSR